jgi:hypothetical protein
LPQLVRERRSRFAIERARGGGRRPTAADGGRRRTRKADAQGGAIYGDGDTNPDDDPLL